MLSSYTNPAFVVPRGIEPRRPAFQTGARTISARAPMRMKKDSNPYLKIENLESWPLDEQIAIKNPIA